MDTNMIMLGGAADSEASPTADCLGEVRNIFTCFHLPEEFFFHVMELAYIADSISNNRDDIHCEYLNALSNIHYLIKQVDEDELAEFLGILDFGKQLPANPNAAQLFLQNWDEGFYYAPCDLHALIAKEDLLTPLRTALLKLRGPEKPKSFYRIVRLQWDDNLIREEFDDITECWHRFLSYVNQPEAEKCRRLYLAGFSLDDPHGSGCPRGSDCLCGYDGQPLKGLPLTRIIRTDIRTTNRVKLMEDAMRRIKTFTITNKSVDYVIHFADRSFNDRVKNLQIMSNDELVDLMNLMDLGRNLSYYQFNKDVIDDFNYGVDTQYFKITNRARAIQYIAGKTLLAKWLKLAMTVINTAKQDDDYYRIEWCTNDEKDFKDYASAEEAWDVYRDFLSIENNDKYSYVVLKGISNTGRSNTMIAVTNFDEDGVLKRMRR